MIYLASPYTDPDPKVMQMRYEMVCEACAGLANKKRVVFSPVAHWHPIAIKYDLPRDYKFWEIQNYGVISCCFRFYVLTLNGWDTSIGIKYEVEYAEKHGKLIENISLSECR